MRDEITYGLVHWRVFHFKGFSRLVFRILDPKLDPMELDPGNKTVDTGEKIIHPKDGMLQCWTLPTNQIYSLYATFPPAILGSEFFTSNFETNVAAPSSFLS